MIFSLQPAARGQRRSPFTEAELSSERAPVTSMKDLNHIPYNAREKFVFAVFEAVPL